MDRLRGVAVERDADAHAHDVEALVDDRPRVLVGDRRRAQQMPGDDGHLMAAPGELPRLSVDVLGNAAKHRVVVIGDDGDPHAGARASITVDARAWHSRYESASVRRGVWIYWGQDADLRVSLPRRTPLRGRPAVLRRARHGLRGLRQAGAARAVRACGALQGQGLLRDRLRPQGRQRRQARLGRRRSPAPRKRRGVVRRHRDSGSKSESKSSESKSSDSKSSDSKSSGGEGSLVEEERQLQVRLVVGPRCSRRRTCRRARPRAARTCPARRG